MSRRSSNNGLGVFGDKKVLYEFLYNQVRKLYGKLKKHLIITIGLVVFLSPILFYVCQFGAFGLSNNHSKWAEVGSFFSGIYSPFIAFFALVVLICQVISQNQINKHYYDQAFIEQSREDLHFYINKLELYLNTKVAKDQSIQDVLNNNFCYLSDEELRSANYKNLCNVFVKKYRLAHDLWLAIYPLLIGLDTNKEFPYNGNFNSSLLKLSSTLSLNSCIALDSINYSLNDKLDYSDMYFLRKV